MTKEQIKRIRLIAMLTQDEFAKEIGVRNVDVSRWETGTNNVSIRNQRKIVEFCKAQGIDWERAIKGE